MARASGITTDLDPVPSIVLGSQEVSVFDMAAAYGTFATGGIQIDPVLVTQLTSVSAVANEEDGVVKPAVPPVAVEGTLPELECGDQIETAVYAFDVFVPLLDLRQESKCEISERGDAWGWRVAKGVYAIIGWYAISMFILTVSGVLRRNVEPG